jgi:hypothetical protein
LAGLAVDPFQAEQFVWGDLLGRDCCGYDWIQKRLERRKEEESPSGLKRILNHPSTVVQIQGCRVEREATSTFKPVYFLVRIKMLFLDIHEIHHDMGYRYEMHTVLLVYVDVSQ